MSDSNSESSTDSDNNRSPFFVHYLSNTLGFDYELDNIKSLPFVTDSSSGNETDLINHTETLFSDNETLFNNYSDDFDCPDDNSDNSSRYSSISKIFKRKQVKKIKITPSKSNYWCLPKELYNREIGQYNTRAQWGYKFYQSAVGVHKLKLSKLLRGHQGSVNSLDFNKAGDIILSGSDDLSICLWDWSKGKRLLNYNSFHTRSILQTKFLTTHGDAHIVSSGQDGLVVLCTVSDNDVIYSKIIARHGRSCNKVGVHHETPYVVLSCGDDGIVKNIDIRESLIHENEEITNILQIKNVHGSSMHIYGIDINPMKPYEFIVNGNDEYVRMYDRRRLTVDPIKIFYREPKSTIIKETDNIDIHRTDDSASNGTDNNDVDDTDHGVIDVADKYDSSSSPSNVDSDNDEEEEDLSSVSVLPDLSSITSAVYSYCGTEILASYSEDDIYLFDAYGRSNYILHNYAGHMNKMTANGISFYGPRSDYVVSGSDCGYVFIWDKKTEAIVQKKLTDKRSINVLEAHPHMPTLVTSGLDKTIKVWEPLNRSHQPNKKKLRLIN